MPGDPSRAHGVSSRRCMSYDYDTRFRNGCVSKATGRGWTCGSIYGRSTGLKSYCTSLLRSCNRLTAGERDGYDVDAVQEQLPAGQPRLRDTGSYGRHHPLSRISVAVRQAEDDPEVSTMKSRATAKDLFGLCPAISAVLVFIVLSYRVLDQLQDK